MTAKPRVWCRFVVNNIKLRVQDAPNEWLDNVLDMFITYFAPEETMHKIAGIHKRKEAQEECREFVREMMQDANSVLICCPDENPEIVEKVVAASMMSINRKDDPDEDFDFKTKTEEVGKLFSMMDTMFSKYDALKQLGVDSLYDDRGIVVHPDFRRFGIAQKMFNVRRMVCRDENIPMTGAWMTTFGSQKAASRDGWDTAFEISYEDFGNETGIVFENVPPTCKYMVGKSL